MVLDALEVNLLQVDASDGAVVHAAIVDDTVCHVRSRGPLGGAGDIDGDFSEGKLDAYRDIEVIQYLEALEHGFLCCFLLWCGSLIESGANKAGRRSDISRNAQEAAARAEWGYGDVSQ